MTWLVVAAAVLAPDSLAGAVSGERAPATVKLTASALFELARRAEQDGDSRLAERAYEALARDPDRDVRAEALFRHGRLLTAAGNLPKAAALLRRVIDDRPNAMPVRLELAALLD
ncbi:MAG TPA: tetratricopeptide repeat protein, partial [Sphingomicrobium sp.]|nr:tetratricopeptide repeat protein [Sphingomicrobium sp.]